MPGVLVSALRQGKVGQIEVGQIEVGRAMGGGRDQAGGMASRKQ